MSSWKLFQEREIILNFTVSQFKLKQKKAREYSTVCIPATKLEFESDSIRTYLKEVENIELVEYSPDFRVIIGKTANQKFEVRKVTIINETLNVIIGATHIYQTPFSN